MNWNWEVFWTIAFFVFVLAGLAVFVGEGIVAFLSRDSVMEGRGDELQPLRPLRLEEPTSPVLPEEPLHHRVPAFVPIVEDEEFTLPLKSWESGRTYVSRSHNGTDLTS